MILKLKGSMKQKTLKTILWLEKFFDKFAASLIIKKILTEN